MRIRRWCEVARERSVVVRATQVVAAMDADQLAVVAGEAMAAGGADLAVVVDREGLFNRGGGGLARMGEDGRTTL